MQKLKVGIIGATGMVGQRFIMLLHEHPYFDITALVAGPRSAGQRYADAVNGSVILVSHSMEDMAHYCDDVVVMNKGKIHSVGTVDEIFSRPEELEAVGLDVPSVSRIASALIKAGVPLQGKLYTVDGVRAAIAEYLAGGRK